MTFVLLMAGREIRASWRRLLFFFVCVAIGVGAIVALRSMIQNIRNGLTREARALIAGDVVIGTNRSWTPQLRAEVDHRLADAPVVARQEAVEVASMVRPAAGEGANAARMVELRGVQAGFPFYGSIGLDGGATYSHDLIANHGALVRPELLAQLALRVGDRLIVGGVPFTIRGVITQEPGRRVGAFSLGSRVLVDYDDLMGTGLLSFGSRANYQILLKMTGDPQPLVRDLRQRFRDEFVSVRSYRSTEDQIGDDLLRAENYLSLVGFVILALGGIGVWSVTRVFVRQKIKSVAILKCVGATTRQVLAAYVLQVVMLGLAGSALGVLLARVAIASIPDKVAVALGGARYGLTASAVWQGVSVGLLVSLLFSLVPLLEVRRVKPLLLLRGGIGGGQSGVVAAPWWTIAGLRSRLADVDWLQVAAGALVTAALVAIASWQAASFRIGLIVCAGFAAVALVLTIAGVAIVYAVRPISRVRLFAVRHAVLSFARPGNQTRVILLAVGLGSFFVIGVRTLQSNLLRQFSLEMSAGGADMFIIEILPKQVDEMRAFLDRHKAAGAGPPRLIPVLRARVTGVRGRDVNLSNVEDVRGQGSLAREYTITYRDHLEPNEKIIDGKFWAGEPPLAEDARPAEVSIERSIHDRFHINVGDIVRFDILGRVMEARVSSVRDVEWEDARNGGFMFVFRPGPFEHAPQTWIGILQAAADPTARGRFQRELVTRFPNVSAIDVKEILTTIQQAVANVTLAITIVGAVALLSGVLILVGAVAMTKFQRVYEAAILRTLGASTRTIGTMLAVEYGGLGLLAGAIGAAGALVLSWAICRHVLDIPWRPAPGIAALGAIATTALVGVVGVAASYDVLRRKPLSTLRAE
jgi:putative ABC transport system permease protein